MKTANSKARYLVGATTAALLLAGCAGADTATEAATSDGGANTSDSAVVSSPESTDPEASTSAPAGTEDGEPFVIGVSWSALQTEYFIGLRDAVQAAADELDGVEVTHVDAENDPVAQLDQLQQLASQSPDVIVINAADSEAIASGVATLGEDFPVFTLDRQVPGAAENIVTHVGASAEEAGYAEAQLVCQEVGPDARVLGIWGLPGLEVVEARVAGVERGLTDNDCNLELLDESYEQGEGAEAAAVTTGDWLQVYPEGEVDAIIAFADSQAAGALQELEAQGRDDVVVTGAANFGDFHDAICDDNPLALGTVDFNLPGQGQTLVDTIMEYRDGATDFPEWVTTPQIVVTSENQETC